MVKIAAVVRRRRQEGAQDLRSAQPAAGEPDQEGAAGAHAGRLGRGEQAAIQPADDEDEQQQRGPDVAQRREPLAPRCCARPAGM